MCESGRQGHCEQRRRPKDQLFHRSSLLPERECNRHRRRLVGNPQLALGPMTGRLYVLIWFIRAVYVD
jgi:hypothetical protein